MAARSYTGGVVVAALVAGAVLGATLGVSFSAGYRVGADRKVRQVAELTQRCIDGWASCEDARRGP